MVKKTIVMIPHKTEDTLASPALLNISNIFMIKFSDSRSIWKI
jgi:hypothetical protein